MRRGVGCIIRSRRRLTLLILLNFPLVFNDGVELIDVLLKFSELFLRCLARGYVLHKIL